MGGIPRFLICCLLAKAGAGYIVRSDQIIVDTVAVLFVVDIATFIYSAFTSNARRFVSFLFVNFVYPVLLVCFSVAFVWFSRQACHKGEDFQSSLKLGETTKDLLELLQGD